jgi:hypothetical protein
MTNAHMEQVTTVWGGLLPTDRNTFVSVWSLDGTGISGRQFTQEAS